MIGLDQLLYSIAIRTLWHLPVELQPTDMSSTITDSRHDKPILINCSFQTQLRRIQNNLAPNSDDTTLSVQQGSQYHQCTTLSVQQGSQYHQCTYKTTFRIC